MYTSFPSPFINQGENEHITMQTVPPNTPVTQRKVNEIYIREDTKKVTYFPLFHLPHLYYLRLFLTGYTLNLLILPPVISIFLSFSCLLTVICPADTHNQSRI